MAPHSPHELARRARAVLEAHGEGLCAVSLLCWLARYRGGDEHRLMLRALGEALYHSHGVELSAAFEALAFPEHEGIRQRFEALEHALGARSLADLPPRERPH